jgi:TPR repeat protein
MKTVLRKLMVFGIALVCTGAVQAGDFEDGMAAYKRQDYATALAKWRRAALKDDAEAQFNIGLMYNKGQGVARDGKEAARWFQLAALQGVAEAQVNLGVMYDEGQGVAQDYKEAVRWYKLAAKKNKDRAQFNLALMYYEGKGVLQDYVRAHMWFNIAAIGGDNETANNRDSLARTMTPQQIEQAQRMARECMNSNFKNCD